MLPFHPSPPTHPILQPLTDISIDPMLHLQLGLRTHPLNLTLRLSLLMFFPRGSILCTTLPPKITEVRLTQDLFPLVKSPIYQPGRQRFPAPLLALLTLASVSPEAFTKMLARTQKVRRAKEAAERIFNRRSQNPQYFERQLPPPEMIEIPTAHDVRFGIKGAKSPGWEDVRRRSMASQNGSGTSPDGSGGWRRSFFAIGGLGHSSSSSATHSFNTTSDSKKTQDQQKAPESVHSDPTVGGPLSLKVENGPVRRDPTILNPYANFVRPISMAPDESLKMMRGDRSDMFFFDWFSNLRGASKSCDKGRERVI
ncbi:hypothetical protein CROQUDRAFT_296346 [Cronartium quercuum f. sp. fusiforme G11]|uniref:Uncharacterized protein n=1 Tax=Cronartium quercuum f. sp. fusiforme G11 TaxID=708437 RepID=A0A9P6N949_9BASI|nr:hypothetical protein CROQUDRAFT_296346 [Cronartium quercuum f. sp. fusiforme G11]